MDANWLFKLDQHTAVIVPTRSLANALTEQTAFYYIDQGRSVWESPNILVWQDYMNLLWQLNRDQITAETGAHTLISAQQSLMLWTQVIEVSRRQERALTLLNVQQTVKAVQRSWRLIHDWQVDLGSLCLDHIADTEQFVEWLRAYQELLSKRGLIDESLLLTCLCRLDPEPPFKKLIWYSYDLVTAAQNQLNQMAQLQNMRLVFSQPRSAQNGKTRFHVYVDAKAEMTAVLENARSLIEQDPRHRINIVVPDLQSRQTEIRELAHEVFYPSASPLEVQVSHTAYRFSLGLPLNQWAAIETALSVIGLLKNRITVAELSFLLRNQFLSVSRNMRTECRLFERWLKRQRIRNLTVESLPVHYQQCLDYLHARDQVPERVELLGTLLTIAQHRAVLQSRLAEKKAQTEFAALNFTDWVLVFNNWLTAWGWRTEVAEHAMDSVQYQLLQRWHSLLEEFAAIATVQKQAGLGRACEILQQMTRDAVFLPKAVASPILISGIYEAIGQPAKTCFLTGMSQAYPAAPQTDSFVANRLLTSTGYPDATADGSFSQVKKIIGSLLSSAENTVISYARNNQKDREIHNQPSPLYRNQNFAEVAGKSSREPVKLLLECYQDTQGPAWPEPGRAKGGSVIFVNQSNCAFKAFATHQLGFLSDEEAEFGLDGLDRGSVVHRMLEKAWALLQSQSNLKGLSNDALASITKKIVAAVVNDPCLELSPDKLTLLQYEKPRLQGLLLDWLSLEAKRPVGFAVVEREAENFANFAGIEFKFIVDRLDMTDDGRTVIIDYKTGEAARSDWQGERLKNPQLPLYAVALDKIKRKPVSGIAYAKVRQYEHAFEELCEADIFRSSANNFAKRREDNWKHSRDRWPEMFEQLAAEFLAGQAQVNPIDQNTCRYCELHAICRISQLKQSIGSA